MSIQTSQLFDTKTFNPDLHAPKKLLEKARDIQKPVLPTPKDAVTTSSLFQNVCQLGRSFLVLCLPSVALPRQRSAAQIAKCVAQVVTVIFIYMFIVELGVRRLKKTSFYIKSDYQSTIRKFVRAMQEMTQLKYKEATCWQPSGKAEKKIRVQGLTTKEIPICLIACIGINLLLKRL